MGRYILGRIVQLLPVLWLISLIVFMIMHVLPGDPAELMLAGAEGGAITPERLRELTEMGLTIRWLCSICGSWPMHDRGSRHVDPVPRARDRTDRSTVSFHHRLAWPV